MNYIYFKNNLVSKGNSLIGIIIALVIVGLIIGGLYYYFLREIPDISKDPEEPIIYPESEIEMEANFKELRDFIACENSAQCEARFGEYFECREGHCALKEDETIFWRIYRNEEHGFEIKYPAWVERLETRLPIDKSALQLFEFIIPCYSPLKEVERNCISVRVIRESEMCQLGEKFLVVELAENPSQLPIKDWVQKNVIEKTEFFGEHEYGAYRDIGPPRDVSLGGKEGIIISFAIEFKAGGCEVIYLPKKSKVYIIGVCIYEAFLGPCSMYPNSDDIISTFRFLE